jgi:hypothetical protein
MKSELLPEKQHVEEKENEMLKNAGTPNLMSPVSG